MSKVVILADIHSNLEALQSVLFDIKSKFGEEVKYILAGDYIDYGANPNEVCEILQDLPLLTNKSGFPLLVRGNHDLAIVTNDTSRFRTEHGKLSFYWTRDNLNDYNKKWISSLSDGISNEYLTIVHGGYGDIWKNIFPKNTPDLDELVNNYPDSKIIIVAHSHLQFLVEYRGRMILNPGSVGQSRNGVPKAHYSVIDSDSLSIDNYSVEYNIKLATSKIMKNQLPKFNATRLFLGI